MPTNPRQLEYSHTANNFLLRHDVSSIRLKLQNNATSHVARRPQVLIAHKFAVLCCHLQPDLLPVELRVCYMGLKIGTQVDQQAPLICTHELAHWRIPNGLHKPLTPEQTKDSLNKAEWQNRDAWHSNAGRRQESPAVSAIIRSILVSI